MMQKQKRLEKIAPLLFYAGYPLHQAFLHKPALVKIIVARQMPQHIAYSIDACSVNCWFAASPIISLASYRNNADTMSKRLLLYVSTRRDVEN